MDAAAGIVAVAGEALIDVVPAPVAGYFEFAPGGSAANVAVSLARLDVPVRMLARLADDLPGRRLRAHLAARALRTVHELLAVCDVVKVSEEDLCWLQPGRRPIDVIDDWLGRGPLLVAVTLGPAGAVAGTATGLRASRPGRAVTVVDTVGAGDSFSGALLAGLHRRGLLGADRRAELRGLDLPTLDDLLNEAIAAASLTVTRRGANPPTLAELRPWS